MSKTCVGGAPRTHVEDMRRRCAAHDRFMAAHPDAVAFSEAWADRNLGEQAVR